MKRALVTRLMCASALASLAVCGPAMAQDAAPAVTAQTVTQATASGDANKAVLLTPRSGAPRVIATAGLGGLEIYDLTGRRLGAVEAGEAGSLDVRENVRLGDQTLDLVVATDTTQNALRFYAFQDDKLEEIGARAVPLGFAVEGVCLFRNAPDGGLYAIAVGDGGEFDQQLIYTDAAGKLDARLSRRIGLPSPAEHCVADDRSGDVYVSEQAVGLWKFSGDPEADATPTLIDAPRLGHVTEELGGLALYDGGEGARYLIASDASSGDLFFYDRGDDDAWRGKVSVKGLDGAAVAEPGGLFSVSTTLSAALPHGALLVSDEDAVGGANYKLLSMADLAGPLNLPLGSPQPTAVTLEPAFKTVVATVETVPVASAGDAADDPAIWANLSDPAASLIIATDKKSGLYLYDMQGQVVQHLPDGKMNNVDLREGFMLGGQPIILVTASDRTHKTIAIYRLDPEARRLVEIADGPQPTEQGDPYGQCMYRSPITGKTYVFINDSNGEKRQWELVDAGNGRVRAVRVRDFAFSSQVEGCVADDHSGALYVNEEDEALWKLSAEPDGGAEMTVVQRVVDNPALKDDLEGISLYDLGDGRGYLIVSSQGNNSYAVYRREGDHAYLGSFAVVANPQAGIDGISETDGLDVTSANLGPGFEHGAMVAQDGRNMLPNALQNYKYVPWSAIAEALGLEMR